jgi:hypothetical protein
VVSSAAARIGASVTAKLGTLVMEKPCFNDLSSRMMGAFQPQSDPPSDSF